MQIKEISVNSPLYAKALDLRYLLFFEKFDLPRSVTADELEAVSIHIAISKNEELLAYGRLSPVESGTFRISQIVVPVQHRRKGLALKLLGKLIEIATLRGAKILRLNSQLTATALYRKVGFRENGDVYQVQLTGVEHIKMIYDVYK